jgi:hypothetical protein
MSDTQTAARRLWRWPAASLERRGARCSGGWQVGTKGWSRSIEQRDGFAVAFRRGEELFGIKILVIAPHGVQRVQQFAHQRDNRPQPGLAACHQPLDKTGRLGTHRAAVSAG